MNLSTMDIKEIILRHLKKNKEVRISEIVEKTGFSRAYIHRFFSQLQGEGKIVLVGKTNMARYVLAGRVQKPLFFRRTAINRNLSEDAILGDIKKETAIFDNLGRNIAEILDYAFTEMLNNAIEHSKSQKIFVQIEKTDNFIWFAVTDFGVGIFDDIKNKFQLSNTLEAIELLLKGKQTTAPKEHTGEGIFFTSKAADKLIIKSSNKKVIFDNIINDIFVGDIQDILGTKIIFEISRSSKRKLAAIFKEYTNENFIFDKTKVTVKLFELSDRSYVSRSHARRLLFGLEKFKKVILDFKKVDTLGQAFADEVFRVWQKKHPAIAIEYINTSESVEFMIKHVIQ